MSYHLNKTIPKGTLGESSKLLEEVLELRDAEEQSCRVMALAELSDLVGAIELYLEAKYPGFDLWDLDRMASITRRAFESGRRK